MKTLGISEITPAICSYDYGIGMCFVMVWEQLVLGIVIGLAGIVAFLALIPIVKGLK